MECSVIDARYMGLGYSQESQVYMEGLQKACKSVGGNFSLLWHNSHFDYPEDKLIYLSMLRSNKNSVV